MMQAHEIDATIAAVIGSLEHAMKQDRSPGLRDVYMLALVVRAMRPPTQTDPIVRPSFNHSRADGPYDPCPVCLPLMSRAALIALVEDLRACARPDD